ncbi:uncharacterized protein LOC144094406 [Amblyomma americanum]
MPGIRFFRCPRCDCQRFSLRCLFRHLWLMHGHEANWVCGLNGCMNTFKVFTSYKRHVYRNHAEIIKRETAAMVAPQLPLDQGQSECAPLEDIEETPPKDGDQDKAQSERSEYVKQLAMLLLKWKEGRRLTESTVDELANDVISFLKSVIEDGYSTTEEIANVKQLLCSPETEQLLTRHGRFMYWKMHLSLVEPRTVVLGRKNGKIDSMQYVPLCKVLQILLEKPSFSDNFNVYLKHSTHLCSVFDGKAFREHTFFPGDDTKICIQLYSDEFEVWNPLGSKRGKHKIMAVYFSLLNLSKRLRSTLSHIHLALLVEDKHVKTYGMAAILAPLLEDIHSLESDGVFVNESRVKGSIFVFTGDNLSTHRIGGFQQSFSHGRIRRFCMALHHEITYKYLESDFSLRTPAGHQHHINMLNAGLPTGPLYGVKQACAITSQGFNPTQHFPTDVMHDMHKGVIPFVLKHIISSLISQGFFSLDQLNKSIAHWRYDPRETRNKPEAIQKQFLQGKATMKGSPSENFCLFRHLASFVGEFVPLDDEIWHLYLLLREIMDIIMCPEISVSLIAYLQRKIHFFLLDFKALFPAVTFPCKTIIQTSSAPYSQVGLQQHPAYCIV